MSAGLFGARLLLGEMVGERLADRVGRGLDEAAVAAAHPVERALQAGRRPLEAGHDVAREQLVGPQRRLPVGPLVAEDEEGAEAAALLLESLDLTDGVVRGADDAEARLAQEAEHVVEELLAAGGREREDVVE